MQKDFVGIFLIDVLYSACYSWFLGSNKSTDTWQKYGAYHWLGFLYKEYDDNSSENRT